MPATRDGKTWRSQFYYEDWQGIRHKKNKRGFKTKAEAEEWERNFRQQQRKDLDINFENFVEIYFADVENRLRESTIKNKRYSQYRTAIEKWKKETGKEPVAHGIRAKLAEKKQEIQNEQKNKQHTRSQNKNRGAR
ncbi:MAG: Arm DNA-binding domain-containing protein [Roseburia sp.]